MQGMRKNALGSTRAATRLAFVAVAAAVALVLFTGRAQADPPVLQSIGLPLYQNHPTFHWALPTSDKGKVRSNFVETAKGSDVGVGGYFLQKNLVSYNPLDDPSTSFTDTYEYKPGTYFVHIAGHDPKCVGGVCEQVQ